MNPLYTHPGFAHDARYLDTWRYVARAWLERQQQVVRERQPPAFLTESPFYLFKSRRRA
jgi:hypothetical protein